MQTTLKYGKGIHSHTEYPTGINANALESELRTKVRGEVRFDRESRALYATDGSIYRQVPIGVVLPEGTDDVITTVATARQYGAPILPRGGGTSLKGQCCNTAVVLDLSKYMNQIITLDPQSKLARVQPGVICDDLRNAAEPYHLTFGPDPATHNHCTFGGMIGNKRSGSLHHRQPRYQDQQKERQIAAGIGDACHYRSYHMEKNRQVTPGFQIRLFSTDDKWRWNRSPETGSGAAPPMPSCLVEYPFFFPKRVTSMNVKK